MSENKDYSNRKVYSDKNSSFTIKGLKANTTYYIKAATYVVRGGKNYYSNSYNFNLTTRNIKTPALISTDSSSSAITVKLDRVSGAAGYRIYIADNKNFKNGICVTSKSPVITKTNLKAYTTYYVKAHSYVLENGVNYWSSPCTIVSCSTKSQDTLFYIENTANVYTTKFAVVGKVNKGSYYSGYSDLSYPDYVVINYMSSCVLIQKSNVSIRDNAKVLQTGAVGQMGGSIYGYAACGPTCAAILLNSQKNSDWNKDELIIYAENNNLNDQGSLREYGGMTAPKVIQLINEYSGGKYAASNIYGSNPTDILKQQIDKGNRAIVVVQYASSIVTHYNSDTHFVVVCGYEYINGVLYFYYADSFYGNGPRSLNRVNANTLGNSMSMVIKEPRCIITVK